MRLGRGLSEDGVVLNEPPEPAERLFHVDLRGVVNLLSRHIYSSPRVYIRELLQNGVDAITARAEVDGTWQTRGIRVFVPDRPGADLMVTDDGIGLTADEVTEVLSTVGGSSKRDVFDLPRSGYLGQFGIGLLSCFLVSDEIVVRSRSVRGTPAIEWRGTADGTYAVRELVEDLPLGTTVSLSPRPGTEAFTHGAALAGLVAFFGRYLPAQITLVHADGREVLVTEPPPFLADDRATVTAYARDLLGADPIDVIRVSVPRTQTDGVILIRPNAPTPGARQTNVVYLGGMLLSDHAEILPSWAFFATAIVNSSGLRPTASREDLVDDDALEETKSELGEALRAWIVRMGTTEPHRMAGFVATHGLALKNMALADPELAASVARWLLVDTTNGMVTVDQVLRRSKHVRYAEYLDEYRQVASFSSPDDLIVNGGYTYDSEIVRMLPSLYPGVTVEQVTPRAQVAALTLPPLEHRDAARKMESRVSDALTEVGVRGSVRDIPEASLPAVLVMDDAVLRALDRRRAAEAADSLWGGVLSSVDAVLGGGSSEQGEALSAVLCVNWASPLIQSLAACVDEAVFSRTVHLLYVQALLAGHHPLTGMDRTLMNRALADVLALSIGTDAMGPVPGQGM